MKFVTSIMLVMIVVLSVAAVSATRNALFTRSVSQDPSYLLIGGQNGTWFGSDQDPRLERIDLGNYSVSSLSPVPGDGTVWGGGWNGSQWLISGWGIDEGSNGSNPYIFLYNGQNQVVGDTQTLYSAETTWIDGDIFAASSNGRYWLLSGLGSGNLTSYGDGNHMSLAVFDGSSFTDLSRQVPRQTDAILYTNAWNGQYWLVGGGFGSDGSLFTYDGRTIVSLTNVITEAVPSFGSVQSVAWNGLYWLIGGVGFLAAYDGHQFTDLTPKLDSVLAPDIVEYTSVNSIAWNGYEWMVGGGTPVAQTYYGHAWLVSYSNNQFTDLTPKLYNPSSINEGDSSILSIASVGTSWVVGGYLRNQGWLITDLNGSFTNISRLVSSYTYVNWVGANSQGNGKPTPYYRGYHGPTQPQTAVIVWARERMVILSV